MEGNWQSHYFCIAEHQICISFRSGQPNGMALLPSYEPFRVVGDDAACVMRMEVDDKLPVVPKERRIRVRTFDTGNGDTIVNQVEGGGYQFIINDVRKRSCCLLIADATFSHCRCALNGDTTMRAFGLNSALLLAFGFATSGLQTLLIHASLVRHGEYGYAFIARSGTGKSTQVAMWLRCIPGCDLMNDDNPVVRVIGDTAFIYGSPWSGKTPCYRQVKARLGAITRIERAPANSIEHLPPYQAFATLVPSCSSMKWDETLYDHVCKTVSKVVSLSNIYTLHCLPNEEAAKICFHTIAQGVRLQVPNAVLLPEVVRLLDEGHTVTLPLRGFSMRPFLENGRDKALLVKPRQVGVGDPVLAEVAAGQYVFHRIIAIRGDEVTLRGDGNLQEEHCRMVDVKAAVVGFYRKGRKKLDPIDGWKWRTYSFVWTRLYPVRRYLLAVYRRLVLNEWGKLGEKNQ